MKLKATACIEAPKEKVWQVLSDVANIDLWVDPVLQAYCKNSQTRGAGTIRICNLKGNIKVEENFIAWDEGKSFTYEAIGAPLIKSAKNTWSVEPVNGKTLVTSESEVELKGGIFAKLLEPLLILWSRRVGGDALAALKYFVENGHPYQGKLSKLPRASAIC